MILPKPENFDEIQKIHDDAIDAFKAKFTQSSLKTMIDQSRQQGFDPLFALINSAALKQMFPFWESGDMIFDNVTLQPSKYSEVEKVYLSKEKFEIDKYESLEFECFD